MAKAKRTPAPESTQSTDQPITVTLPSAADPTMTEVVTSVHILDGVSCSISTDGTMAMQVFLVTGKVNPDGSVGSPRKFGITYPTAKAGWMVNVMNEARVMAMRQNAPIGGGLQHTPQRYDIATSPLRAPDGVQGLCAVCFDQKTPQEYTLVMPNVEALQFLKLMEMAILPMLSPQERTMWVEAQARIKQQMPQSAIQKPPGIIIPPVGQ